MPALPLGGRVKKPAKTRAPREKRVEFKSPPPARARKREERRKRLVKEAVDYFDTAVEKDALAAATDRACDYVSSATWSKLTGNWSGKRCGTLAGLARDILEGKDQVHAGVGRIAGYVVGFLRGGRLERAFAEEIASRIPLPVLDEQATATARGLQIVGIGVCCMQGYDLSRCACFVDVAKEEGKAQLKRLILTGAEDWVALHSLRPR